MPQETRPCPEGDLGVLSLAPCASRTRAVRSGAAGTVGSAQPLAARISYSLSSFAPSQVAGSGAVWGPAASAPCAPRAPRRCCEQTDLRGVRSGAATLPASSPGHPLQTGPGSLAQTGGVPPPCPVRSHLALRTPRAMGPARLLCHPDVLSPPVPSTPSLPVHSRPQRGAAETLCSPLCLWILAHHHQELNFWFHTPPLPSAFCHLHVGQT